MVMLRDTWQSYLPHGTFSKSSSIRVSVQFFFLIQFSRPLLGSFRYSKWIMCGTFRKLEKYNFQRYQVCANRSSDKKVMALGSRGVGAVFMRFSGEDSGQTREATGELRVARCSWSCHLSNAPGLADQITVSRKESAHEGGCPGGKTCQIFSAFSLFFCLCLRARLT